MFELQSMTYFSNGADLGHATVIMNRDNHVAKFEVIFKVDENDEWHFYRRFSRKPTVLTVG